MKTTNQLLELINASKFLISTVTNVKNQQIAVMSNINSSTCIDILSNLASEGHKDELQYLISNLINDLLVMSEDIKNGNVENGKAIAVLFKLTSDELGTHLLMDIDSNIQRQAPKKENFSGSLPLAFAHLN